MIGGEFDLSVGSMLGAVAMFFMLFMTEWAPLFFGEVTPNELGWVVVVAIIGALLVAAILGYINGYILVSTGIPSFIVTLGTLLIYRAIPLVAIPGGRILRYRDFYADFPTISLSPVWGVIAGLLLLALVGYIAYRILPRLYSAAQTSWENRNVPSNNFGLEIGLFRWVWLAFMTLVMVVLLLYFIGYTGYHAGNIGTPYEQGVFEMINGRWSFTLENTAFFVSEDPAFWQLAPLEFENANFRNSIVWWILLVMLFTVILNDTSYGNSVFAVGGNAGAARANGINVDRVKVLNFVIVALLVGVAAILDTTRNPSVDPLKGQQWELEVIAMTVIGGALLTGGYGSVTGTLLGALVFAMLQTGLVLIGVPAQLFQGVIGIIVIGAVVLNTFVRRIPTK